MRKLNLFFLLTVLLPCIYFSSCEKGDSTDVDLPIVVYAKMNVNDTLYPSKGIEIKLNDSTNVYHEIDTVVIGKWMYINASFIDKGKGLSSFKVETNLTYRYKGNDIEAGSSDKYKDSIMPIIKVGGVIYGKDTATVARNWLVLIQDSITKSYSGSTVRLGLVEDDYITKVVCMDIEGNRDSISFPVRFLNRKTIYESRGIKIDSVKK